MRSKETLCICELGDWFHTGSFGHPGFQDLCVWMVRSSPGHRSSCSLCSSAGRDPQGGPRRVWPMGSSCFGCKEAHFSPLWACVVLLFLQYLLGKQLLLKTADTKLSRTEASPEGPEWCGLNTQCTEGLYLLCRAGGEEGHNSTAVPRRATAKPLWFLCLRHI